MKDALFAVLLARMYPTYLDERPYKSCTDIWPVLAGLLLIALSQVFFASMNACVKLLQTEASMPVWELIFIRMLCTFIGCYICTFFAPFPLFLR